MKKLSLLVLVLFSSGCMHGGSVKTGKPAEKVELSAALVKQSVVKGKTSKNELLASLGIPSGIVKNPYHVPKKAVTELKMEVPPNLLAVETWRYWKIDPAQAGNEKDHALMVEVYIDETGAALDYKLSDIEMKEPGQ